MLVLELVITVPHEDKMNHTDFIVVDSFSYLLSFKTKQIAQKDLL